MGSLAIRSGRDFVRCEPGSLWVCGETMPPLGGMVGVYIANKIHRGSSSHLQLVLCGALLFEESVQWPQESRTANSQLEFCYGFLNELCQLWNRALY